MQEEPFQRHTAGQLSPPGTIPAGLPSSWTERLTGYATHNVLSTSLLTGDESYLGACLSIPLSESP